MMLQKHPQSGVVVGTCLTVALFMFAFPPYGIWPFIFFAFLPILVVERQLRQSGKSSFYISSWIWITIFLCQLACQYWWFKASIPWAIISLVVTSTITATPLIVYGRLARNAYWQKWALGLLVPFWIAMEFFHHHFLLGCPWLLLGNSLGASPDLITWYSVTGVLGGSIWILLVNVSCFRLLIQFSSKRLATILVAAILPVGFALFTTTSQAEEQFSACIVQSNYNPYEESLPDSLIIDEMIETMQEGPEVDLYIWPESTLKKAVEKNQIKENSNIGTLVSYCEENQVAILVGLPTYSADNSTPLIGSQNSCLFIDEHGIQQYDKQKLVPGAERFPFPFPEAFITWEWLRSHQVAGQESELMKLDDYHIQPIICYESAFGGFVGSSAKEHYGDLVIITNDAWWAGTAGIHQHLGLAQIRALETRRGILRCANGGISAVITSEGKIESSLPEGQVGTLTAPLSVHSQITFFSKYGNWLGVLATVITLGFVLWWFAYTFRLADIFLK